MNQAISFVLSLVNEGYHPSVVVVEQVQSQWQVRVTLDDWCSLGEGGAASVKLDRRNMPQGTTVKGKQRMADQIAQLTCDSPEVAETWVREIAEIGKSPDFASISGKWVTKPIAWLREPIRSALLRRYGHAT
jgi:hypothetical protein